MTSKKADVNKGPDDKIVAMARRAREERQKGYRAQAFKLYPKICARCGREFSGENLRELTVHHKDHNHDNNPPDGSNWELLCLYCHDNEHARYQAADSNKGGAPGNEPVPASSHTPFAGLDELLKHKK